MSFTRGSILLLSLLVIAAILLTFSLSGVTTLVQERVATVTDQNKRLALNLAEGCMEHVMRVLGNNANYAGNETYTIGSYSCQIQSVQVSGSTYTLGTQVMVGNQIARIRTVLSQRAPPVIFSWQEVASFP